MESDAVISQLVSYALRLSVAHLRVRRAVGTLDERHDGEQVARLVLLLDDPVGDTWSVDEVRELRQQLSRRAAELGLPGVSLTLVPQSESDIVSAFAS